MQFYNLLKSSVRFPLNQFLDHPLDEIKERAMKALALKLQGRLIPRSALTSKYPQAVGTLLKWINEKQKAAPPEALLSALQILLCFAEVYHGPLQTQ